MVVAGEEEATVLLVPEPLDRRIHERHGVGEPGRIECRLVQIKQGGDREGIVVQVAVEPCPAVLERVHEPAVLVLRVQDEPHRIRRRVEPGRFAEDAACPGHAADHQTVPVRHDLLVAAGVHALFAVIEKSLAAIGHDGLQCFRLHPQVGGQRFEIDVHVQDAGPVFEISPCLHAVVSGEQAAVFFPKDFLYFIGRPHEETAFFAFAVGVLGRVEPTAGLEHLADKV